MVANIPPPPNRSIRGSEEVGNHFRDIRVSLSISQNRAALLAGIHQTTLNKIESGDRGVGTKVLARLVVTYGDITKRYYPSRYSDYKTWVMDLMKLIADAYES